MMSVVKKQKAVRGSEKGCQARLSLTTMCQKGRACERACDSGTEWSLQILSQEGIPEMASITGGGVGH